MIANAETTYDDLLTQLDNYLFRSQANHSEKYAIHPQSDNKETLQQLMITFGDAEMTYVQFVIA